MLLVFLCIIQTEKFENNIKISKALKWMQKEKLIIY